MATKKSAEVVPATNAYREHSACGAGRCECDRDGVDRGAIWIKDPRRPPRRPRAQFDKTQAEVKANMEKAMKTAEEFVSFGQGNLEAFAKSSQIWATGVQDLGKHVAANAQAQLEQTIATFKALAGVKSLKEAIDLQSSLARASVEKAVAETGKLTDASLKLAEQAIAPIDRPHDAGGREVRPRPPERCATCAEADPPARGDLGRRIACPGAGNAGAAWRRPGTDQRS